METGIPDLGNKRHRIVATRRQTETAPSLDRPRHISTLRIAANRHTCCISTSPDANQRPRARSHYVQRSFAGAGPFGQAMAPQPTILNRIHVHRYPAARPVGECIRLALVKRYSPARALAAGAAPSVSPDLVCGDYWVVGAAEGLAACALLALAGDPGQHMALVRALLPATAQALCRWVSDPGFWREVGRFQRH